MKLVHIKLELIAQCNDDEAKVFLDPANGELAVESLIHEWNIGDATLSVEPVRKERDDIAAVDWTHR